MLIPMAKVNNEPISITENQILQKNLTRKKSLETNPALITRTFYKGKVMFMCNKQYFHTLEDAEVCFWKLHPTTKKPLPNNPYKDFDINKLLGTNSFTNQIWHHVWDGCDYKCYCKNNFKEMKTRFLKEMNTYRQYHGVKPVKLNSELTSYAQRHAQNLAKLKIIVPDIYKQFGETVGVANIFVAPIIVKKWYEEIKTYDFYHSMPKTKSNMFTQLVWLSTTNVGIGIAKNGENMWIVVKYYPKGNINGKYKNNVLPFMAKSIKQ
ncbi:CAP domain-containing protein [Strongyloides ratti]|uniref:CAP domain-containing protein n=1 Tax=Strongyloides ratti TaxID=34506 RepID=A0A1P6CXI5_STRRB|nr:CAP domain-containing protein [Strongyloides ratti]CEF66061.1 CAP domain-containing protein [Strongyloides ratti]